MSNLTSRPTILIKSLLQLGPGQLGCYGIYRFGLATGHYRRMTPVGGKPVGANFPGSSLQPLLEIPPKDALLGVLGDHVEDLIAEADEIAGGKVRLFGGAPAALELAPPAALLPLAHWTHYEREKSHWLEGRDVKFLWEPARFGWVFPLVRAYQVTGRETYAHTFWQYTGTFLKANPPNLGPQWASAQEVALRLIALAFGWIAFGSANPFSSEQDTLREALIHHARRTAITLVYARSQNNNHLLTEAAGLYTAGLALPGLPEANVWRSLGWKWFHRGLQSQISPDGTYIQQSANYHRLMLQVSLWVHALARQRGEAFPSASLKRLAAATRWLTCLVDPETGAAPNLGANDGAMIFPLAVSAFHDYHPVVQAAARAFTGEPIYPSGPWDEACLWLGINSGDIDKKPGTSQPAIQAYNELNTGNQKSKIHNPQSLSWASIRAVHFTGRPSHADQLHVELWWRGINLARDAGTYLYNAPPPWDNALAVTRVHNTLEVDGRDQMLRAGRFLWLDWAQAEIMEHVNNEEEDSERIVARHNGYRQLGIIHERALERVGANSWHITDRLVPSSAGNSRSQQFHTARLHWLLPDWPWELAGTHLILQSPYGSISIGVTVGQTNPGETNDELKANLFRAGETIAGEGSTQPTLGWYSPTYGQKESALSFTITAAGKLPIQLRTVWLLPE